MSETKLFIQDFRKIIGANYKTSDSMPREVKVSQTSAGTLYQAEISMFNQRSYENINKCYCLTQGIVFDMFLVKFLKFLSKKKGFYPTLFYGYH